MKKLIKYTALLPILATNASAAIWWDSTASGNSYTAGDPLTFDVDPTKLQINGSGVVVGSSEGFQEIEVTASADRDGTQFYAQGGAAGRLQFNNAAPLASGETITFTFDFNMQLFAGNPPVGASDHKISSAAMFRVAASDVEGTLDVSLSGGNDTLPNYFGSTPTIGDLTHSNPGILQYNDGGNFNGDSVFDSFPNATTARFTEHLPVSPAPGGVDLDTQFSIALIDQARNGPDYAYQGWEFSFTNDHPTDALPTGTTFLFTFRRTEF